MAEVAKMEGIPLKGGHGDHLFKNRDEVGKEYGLSGSSVGRLLKVNDLIKPLRNKMDNGSLIFKVGIQISFLPESEQQLVYEQMMELDVKLMMNMAIKKSQKDYGSIEDCRGCLRKVSSIFCAYHLKC